MACSVAARSPLLRNTTARHYAAAAAVQYSAAAVPEVQVVNSKIKIATLDNTSPLAQVSVVFRAGSRNETYDTQGTAHYLRSAAGLGTERSSIFAVTRYLQQIGGSITATGDRESIAYTLQITKDNLDQALPFLEDVATRQVFKPWEVMDQAARIQYEVRTLPDTCGVLELLHKVAYGTGLGYSLYTPKYKIGKINTETLQHFTQSWLTASRCAVVATGIPLAELSAFASSLPIPSNACNQASNADEASKYRGGEIRKEREAAVTTVAVAVEGVSLANEKEALVAAVLQRAIGTGPRVKWGSCGAPLHKHLSNIAGSDPFALSTLNASYTDSGLFGFVLCAPGKVAGSLTKAACSWLKSPQLSDADICRGKRVLTAEVASTADNAGLSLENLQQQALFRQNVTPVASLMSDIENITPSDVNALTGKICRGKLSIASIGDLNSVPHLDELN